MALASASDGSGHDIIDLPPVFARRSGWISECNLILRQMIMFRITKAEEPSRTTLTIDGQLSADSIAAVETCCYQAGSNGRPVQLYLRDVTSVDRAGQKLLSRLAVKGVDLVASGVYTSYLVQALTSDENAPHNPPVESNGTVKAGRRRT